MYTSTEPCPMCAAGIHYAGLSRALRRGPIEEVTLEKFAAGRGFSVQPRVAPKYLGDAVVTRSRFWRVAAPLLGLHPARRNR